MTNRVLLVEEQCASFRDGPWRDSDFDVELIATEPTDWSEPKLIRKMGGDFWRRHRVVEYVPRQALSQSESAALERALDELRAERHKTETWKEKERAALSKAIARIEKLKPTKGTDVEK